MVLELLGACISKAQLVNIKEFKNTNYNNALYDKKMKYQTFSVIVCPVTLKGKVIGVIEILNKNWKNHSFSEQDEAIVHSFSILCKGLGEWVVIDRFKSV